MNRNDYHDNILQKCFVDVNKFKSYYDSYSQNASAAIIFGSRAIECETNKSDIDILFVGEEETRRFSKCDIVWIRQKRIFTSSWLGSELAHHIGYYGHSLFGNNEWKNKTFISNSSVIDKKLRIINRLTNIYYSMDQIDDNKTIDLLVRVYLDIWRLIIIFGNNAVPPSICIAYHILILNNSMPWEQVFSESSLSTPGNVLLSSISRHFSHGPIARLEKLINGALAKKYSFSRPLLEQIEYAYDKHKMGTIFSV